MCSIIKPEPNLVCIRELGSKINPEFICFNTRFRIVIIMTPKSHTLVPSVPAKDCWHVIIGVIRVPSIVRTQKRCSTTEWISLRVKSWILKYLQLFVTIIKKWLIIFIHLRGEPITSIPFYQTENQFWPIPLTIVIMWTANFSPWFTCIPNTIAIKISKFLCRFPVIQTWFRAIVPTTPGINHGIIYCITKFRYCIGYYIRIIRVRNITVRPSRMSPFKPVRKPIVIIIIPAYTYKLVLYEAGGSYSIKCIA